MKYYILLIIQRKCVIVAVFINKFVNNNGCFIYKIMAIIILLIEKKMISLSIQRYKTPREQIYFTYMTSPKNTSLKDINGELKTRRQNPYNRL